MRAVLVVAAAALLTGAAQAQPEARQMESWSDLVEEVPRADWSELGREETAAQVAAALAGINAPFASVAYGDRMAAHVTQGWAEQLMEDAIEQVLVIRDNLAGNPYVRISAFTVGIPWGVSVEFSFPEPEEP